MGTSQFKNGCGPLSSLPAGREGGSKQAGGHDGLRKISLDYSRNVVNAHDCRFIRAVPKPTTHCETMDEYRSGSSEGNGRRLDAA
jgi:hypothetical protein